MLKKLPALQFYVGDWKRDNSVQSCSIAARGLWFEMLLMMHESPHRGYLMLTDTTPMHDEHIARIAGVEQPVVSTLIEELQTKGVFDFAELEVSHGHTVSVIKSRRMSADEEKRKKCSVAGLSGVENNPRVRNARSGIGGKIGGQGSSSSSSTTSSLSKEDIERFLKTEGVEEVWKALPKSRREKPQTTKLQIGVALTKIAERYESDTAHIDWLCQRIAAYYASAQGKSVYYRSAVRWLSEEAYDEDDAVWSSRTEEKRKL